MSITREKIIELGENLIRTRGYNAFSYNDISSELGIKNAAIHYYFPTKAHLGTSIVKTNIQRFDEMVDNMVSRKFNELKQLETFIKIYTRSNRENKLCIIGSLGPAFINLGDTTKRELAKMTEAILVWLSNLLEIGRNKKIFKFSGDSQFVAQKIFSNLIASLQLARINNKMDYKAYCQTIIDELKP